MLAAQPNAVQFDPLKDDTPDTQAVAVRNMSPIPLSYIHLVLDSALNPRALWEQVGGGGGSSTMDASWSEGVAELAALRAHTTKGPQRYTHDITTVIIARGNWCGPPNAKITGGIYCVWTYQNGTRHAWPRLTKWCTWSRRSGMNRQPPT